VNGRYIHSDHLLDELRPVVSKFTAKVFADDLGNLTSSILILHVKAQARILLFSLIQPIKQLLLGSEDKKSSSRIVIADAPRIESKIRSAKGIEYLNRATQAGITPEPSVRKEPVDSPFQFSE
jgi:hypothetical protein